MADEPLNLQFDRAEYSGNDVETRPCVVCKQEISDQYYASGEAVVCSNCAAKLKAHFSGRPTGRDFLAAFAWGAGAAVLGCLIYYAVSLTGYQLSLIAILVGYLVGKAVRKGSRNRGGRIMQVLAVALTYAAICGSIVPLVLTEAYKERIAHPQVRTESYTGVDRPTAVNPGQALFGLLYFFGLSLIPSFHGTDPLWWIILGIGLWQAWKMNAPAQLILSGPFTKPQPPPILP